METETSSKQKWPNIKKSKLFFTKTCWTTDGSTSLAGFPFELNPIDSTSNHKSFAPKIRITVQLMKSPMSKLPQNGTFYKFRLLENEKETFNTATGQFFDNNFIGVINLSLGKKQQKILILFQSEEKDIMALLPDNQGLISSILFNKPFQPFLKMSDEEQAKLVNILEKIIEDQFSVPFQNMEIHGVKNLILMKENLEKGLYTNTSKVVQDLVHLFQIGDNFQFNLSTNLSEISPDDLSVIGGVLVEKLKILLIKNDLSFDETHFQQKIKTPAVLQDGKLPKISRAVQRMPRRLSRKRRSLTKFQKLQDLKKLLTKSPVTKSTYRAVYVVGNFLAKAINADFPVYRNQFNLAIKQLLIHGFINVFDKFLKNSSNEPNIEQLRNCVLSYKLELENVKQTSSQISSATVASLLTGLEMEEKERDDRTKSGKNVFTGKELLDLLEEVFPDHAKDYLRGVSETIAIDKSCSEARDDLFNAVLQGSIVIPQPNANGEFPFVRYRLYPSKQHDPKNTLEGIYRQAESAFLRMVHLGPPSMYGVEKKIFRIDYIKNPELERIFEETKEEFRLSEIPTDEQLMFHGTHEDNIDSILANGFRLDAVPRARPKAQVYGKGIYFSEFPGVSIGYGVLLLCRTLPGKVEDVGNRLSSSNYTFSNKEIPKDFNSRRLSGDGMDDPTSSWMHIMKNTNQILPFCVIHLFDKSKSGPTGMHLVAPQLSKVTSISGTPVSGYSNRYLQHLSSSAIVLSAPPSHPINTATAGANNQSIAAQFQHLQQVLNVMPPPPPQPPAAHLNIRSLVNQLNGRPPSSREQQNLQNSGQSSWRLPQQQQQPPASNQQQSGNNALSSANASGNQSNFFTSYPPYRYSSTQSGPSQFVLQRAPSVSTPMASQGLLVPSLQPGRSGLSNGTISGIQLGGGPLLAGGFDSSQVPAPLNLQAQPQPSGSTSHPGFLHPANLGVSNSSTQNLYDDDIDIKLFDILDSD